MLSHFAGMFVHIVGLWGLGRRGSPVVEVLAVSMVELSPARWIVFVSVGDGLPSLFNELDNPVGVGSIGVVALVPHRGCRWCPFLPDMLIQGSDHMDHFWGPDVA